MRVPQRAVGTCDTRIVAPTPLGTVNEPSRFAQSYATEEKAPELPGF